MPQHTQALNENAKIIFRDEYSAEILAPHFSIIFFLIKIQLSLAFLPFLSISV